MRIGWEGPGGARGGLGRPQVPDQGDWSLAGTDGGPGPACVLQAVTDVVACDVIELFFFHDVTNAFLFFCFVCLFFFASPSSREDVVTPWTRSSLPHLTLQLKDISCEQTRVRNVF